MTFQSTNNLYGFPQALTRVFPAPIISQRVPQTTDYKYPIGQVWIDELGQDAYVLVSVVANSATWNLSASEPGTLDTLTGDSGGAISPSAGNIDIVGTANEITTTGSGDQIAFSIPATFIAPGSIASTTTLAAGTDFSVGGNSLFTGTVGVTGTTTLGALVQVGTAQINASGAATTTIGSATAGAISVDTTAGITLNADAISSFTVTDAGADLNLSSTLGSVNITAGESAANSIVISSTIGGIDITAAGAAAGEDIDITATGSSINLVASEAAVANAIRLNASAADGGIDIDSGTGGITIDSTGAISIDGAAASNFTVTGAGLDLTLASSGGSVAVSSTENTASAISLTANGGTSETIVVTASQGTGAGSIALTSTAGGITLTAGLATADAINFVTSDAGGGIDIDSGTAGFILDTTGAFSIDGAAASNVTTTGAGIDLTLSSSGGSVLVESTENAALAIRLHANGGTSETIQVHADQGTGVGSINLLSDVGGITFTAGLATADAINIVASDAAGGIDIDAGTSGIAVNAANGAITINSGTGAIGISTDASATTVSFATGGAAKTVALGSTNSTSTTVINAGSGDVVVTNANLRITTAAKQLQVEGGAATDFIGTNNLTNGTVTIANTNIAAADRIFLSRIAANGSTAFGMLSYSISAATSFTVTALETATPGDTEVNDQSTFSYFIVRQL